MFCIRCSDFDCLFSLALFIKIPEMKKDIGENHKKESMFTLVKEGILWL